MGLLVVMSVAPALAQSGGQAVDQWESGKWRFGPLAVTPKVELKNLGWDSNVFTETENPKSDFTTTVGAPIDWWLRFGRGRLHGVDYFEGVYFATYGSQSGFNQRHELTLLLPLNRVTPYAGGSYFSTNDRPGYEINARIRHTETGASGGIVVRLSSRLSVDISGRETTYRYQDDELDGNAVLGNAGPAHGELRRPVPVPAHVADHADAAGRRDPRALYGIHRARQRRVPHPARRRVRPVRPHQGQGAGRLPQAQHPRRPACPTSRASWPRPSCRTRSAGLPA